MTIFRVIAENSVTISVAWLGRNAVRGAHNGLKRITGSE